MILVLPVGIAHGIDIMIVYVMPLHVRTNNIIFKKNDCTYKA